MIVDEYVEPNVAELRPSVYAALSAVMEDVQAVKKTGRNTQQNYDFRGVDAVVNAVGPALRKHGVIVVPTNVESEVEHYTTSKGTPMRGVTLTVSFRIYGPAGDYIEATVCGESADSGDKATPKAHSVAFRTLLLQALCIPTDEPDPDSASHERGTVAEPSTVSKPNTKDFEPATEAQRKKLFAVIRDLDAKDNMKRGDGQTWGNYTKNLIAARWDVTSRSQLTKGQIAWLIDHLENESVPF